MTQPTLQTDAFIIGGGPAGLATALAARQTGLHVILADALHPPIDKACGEGLMPDAVTALQSLGVRFSLGEARPFRGIRFLDGRTGLSAQALFPQGCGLAVRRTLLHTKLAERAAEVGAVLRWSARVTLLQPSRVACDGAQLHSRWIVGADGLHSNVRRWAGLQPARRERRRFGFRRHFRAEPWTDFVEVYWGGRCQIAVTPLGPDEISLAAISRDPSLRIHDALRQTPVLAERLAGASPVAREHGAACGLRRLSSIARGNVALIGDASGSVDPVTGEGLGLAFRQAPSLAQALCCGDLPDYHIAHRRIGQMSHRMSRIILWMDYSPWLRQRALRTLAADPPLFARLLGAHVGDRNSSPLGPVDALRLGWRLTRL
jgi:flavin-dependent dehydrogenase